MKTFKLVDGAYRIQETDRKALKEFLIEEIRNTGKTTKGGKLSKGRNFPKIYIDGEQQWFKNKKGIDGFEFSTDKAKTIEKEKRDKHTAISSEHLDKEKLKRWNALKKKYNVKGLELDHIFEIQETGPSRDLLDKWKAKGWISDADYKRDLDILQRASGNDPDTNAQGLTAKENSQKQREVAKKNKSLEKLERRKLSSRFNLGPFKGKTYQQIYASIRENISGTADYKVPLEQRIFGEQVIGNGNGNGRQTQSGALALEKTRSTAFINNATNIAQLAMRNLGLLNMISETATKKKFTTHLGDAAKRGYGNFILAINDPDQRKSDIEQQQMELSSTQNYLKPYQDNLRETIDSTDISTL
tara:strand:+ start:99 stop:1172 length:1074 start_codon:yes stop_codon:yes gene_type:complete